MARRRNRKNKSAKRKASPPQGNTVSVRAPCTCGGENENCFKCFGTGFYDKVVLKSALTTTANDSNPALSRSNMAGPATFSADYRGGVYSVRENGKFSSLPGHDDYGDESLS